MYNFVYNFFFNLFEMFPQIFSENIHNMLEYLVHFQQN